jgi:hypothetical protein
MREQVRYKAITYLLWSILVLVVWIPIYSFKCWKEVSGITYDYDAFVHDEVMHGTKAKLPSLPWGISKSVVVTETSGYYHHLLTGVEFFSVQQGEGDGDSISAEAGRNGIPIGMLPTFIDYIPVKNTIGCANKRCGMNDCGHRARGKTPRIYNRQVHSLGCEIQGWPFQPYICPLRNQQGFLRSVGGTFCRISTAPVSLGLYPGVFRHSGCTSRLLLCLLVQPVSRVRLSLHLRECLGERAVTTVQRFSGESVGPPDLRPLQNGKHRVNDEGYQADTLYAEFDVVAPIATFCCGIVACLWGWWRLRRAITGREAWWGFTAFVCGFLTACVGGIAFGLKFLML